jgi:hypothetical protein
MALGAEFFRDNIYNQWILLFGEDFPFRVFHALFLAVMVSYFILILYGMLHVFKMFTDPAYRNSYAHLHSRRLCIMKMILHQKLDPEVEKLLEKESIALSQNLRWYHYLWIPDPALGFMQEVTAAAGRSPAAAAAMTPKV